MVRILVSIAYFVFLSWLALLPAQAQTVPPQVLDQAWNLGEQLKAITDQNEALTANRRAEYDAIQAALKPLTDQESLLHSELRALRSVYSSDRSALAAIDGKSAGPSNASGSDVQRAAAIRAELARISEAKKELYVKDQESRKVYASEQARVRQYKAQVDQAIYQLKQPYNGNKEALAEIDTKLINAQGQLTWEQQRAQRQAEQAAAKAKKEAEAQAKRDAPGLAALEKAQAAVAQRREQLSAFKPDNDFERDILAAALLHAEEKALDASGQAKHPLVVARKTELYNAVVAMQQKHKDTEAGKHPFTVQWHALAGVRLPDDADRLIKPLRKLLKQEIAAQEEYTAAVKKRRMAETVSNWVTFLIWIGAIIAGIYGLYRYLKSRAGRGRRAMEASNQLAIEAFGKTEEERTKRIDAVFDKRSDSITFSTNHKMSGGKYMGFEMLRSLAAMSPREREALRIAYHLFNIGELEWNNFYWIRLALIFGEGKGQLVGNYNMLGYGESAIEAIRQYMDPVTTEGAVTLALNHLEKVAQRKPDHPVIKKLMGKLMAGNSSDGGLASTEQFRETQAAAQQPGVILGDAEDVGETLKYTGEGSLITVAPPGSGKTQCHVFPTLLTWPGPAVVLDVKGEIYAGTSKWRAENVGPVYKFSPLDPANSHCYNPLTAVRSDPDYLWEDARFLADMMMVPTGAKDPFWENRARDILTAAIAKVCLEEDPTKRPISHVMDIFHGVGWDSFVRALQARVDIPSMSRAGNSLGNMDAKTRDGVLQTGLSSLSAWDGDRIARATKRSDWSPLDLRSGKNPTVYICLKPNEVESYISVLRVFIAQHIRQLTTELPPRDALPILFVLDELPRLRQMPPVEEALEIGRQYGIKLWMFTQSVGQLQNAYPNADGMIGSCAVRMYMNPSLHDGTAQKISDDIGMQESVLDGTRQKIVEPNVLAGPEYKDYVIVMAAGMKPMRLKKHFAYKDETIRSRMGSL